MRNIKNKDNNKNPRDRFNTVVNIAGHPQKFRIDTGADLSVINSKTRASLKIPKETLRPSNKNLVDAGGRSLIQEGVLDAEIRVGERTAMGELYVIDKAPTNLLGAPEIDALGLIPKVYNVKIEEKFPKLYQTLGKLPEKYKIKLRDDAVPYALSVPRKLPIGLRVATEKELKRMEGLGVIERVQEPREWCAGMVVAPKTSGDVRICVDLT